jgi:chromosome segregation ATPase
MKKTMMYVMGGTTLAAALILTMAGCGVSKSEHEILEEKYAKVQEQMIGYNEQAKKIQTANMELSNKGKEMEAEIKKLSEEKDALTKENQKLLKEKQSLEEALKKAKGVGAAA